MVNRFVVVALGAIAITAGLAPWLPAGGKGADPAAPAVFTAGSGAPDDPGKRGGDVMVLERDGSGQFHLTAAIDNEDVEFLVDTGADVVALTESTAERLGLMPAEEDFQPIMKTASGTGYAAPIMLDTIEVGGERFRQVEAVVMKGLGTDLLGQSVLRRMGGVELTGDSMVIRPS